MSMIHHFHQRRLEISCVPYAHSSIIATSDNMVWLVVIIVNGTDTSRVGPLFLKGTFIRSYIPSSHGRPKSCNKFVAVRTPHRVVNASCRGFLCVLNVPRYSFLSRIHHEYIHHRPFRVKRPLYTSTFPFPESNAQIDIDVSDTEAMRLFSP